MSGKQKLPDSGTIRQKWNVVLQTMKSISVPAQALVSGAIPAEVRDGAIVLQFKHVAHANIMEGESGKARKKALQTAIERVFGVSNVGIICEVARQEAPTPKPEREFKTPEFPSEQDTALQDVLDIFNGQIVDE